MPVLTTSHAKGRTDTPLLETTIPVNLRETVEKFGDGEALVDAQAGRRLTYQEFYEEVRRLATGLHQAGVRKGDRLGIWALNRWEWVLIQYATAELGVIMVTINPDYRQHELEYVLKQSEVSTVVSSEQVPLADYPKMVDKAVRNLGTVDRVITMNTETWDEVFNVEADHELLDSIVDTLEPNEPVNIQYTSGTTGFPKGATLTHRNILNNGYFIGETIRYTNNDRIVIPVPFYHCFGMVIGNMAATTHGATMIISGQKYDPETVLRVVEQEKATSLYGVPTMFIAELSLDNFDDFDLSSLRTGVMAGSPCPREIMQKVIDLMHMEDVSICYGMTETSPVSVQTGADDELEYRVSTVGQVGPHLEIKIIDPDTGDVVPIGEQGELCTKGYAVMKGYWNQPEKTAETVVDGWMHTGDMGVMDENGYISVTGRIKDMVIRGGENIYPREIEEFLYTHPDIIDAQVIGVPDDKYGEEVMAWVRLRNGAEPLTAAALREFCLGEMAKYKIPRYVHIVDEFPTTVTGKVRKVQMRETAVELLAEGEIDDFRAIK